MATRPLPDQALLLKLLRYDPETGKLFWRERHISMFTDGRKNNALCKVRSWNAQHAGKEAFPHQSGGYKHGAIYGKTYRAHRIIWKMVTGDEPPVLDHINGDRSDNRFCNLRPATHAENCRNAATYKSNTSGVVGVDYLKAKPKLRRACWRARITVDRELITIGHYDTQDEAIRARKSAERKHGFHPNHGRKAVK